MISDFNDLRIYDSRPITTQSGQEDGGLVHLILRDRKDTSQFMHGVHHSDSMEVIIF